MFSYLVGVDIGGTFTDRIIIDDHGRVTRIKGPSTSADFSNDMVRAVRNDSESLGLTHPRGFMRTHEVAPPWNNRGNTCCH